MIRTPFNQLLGFYLPSFFTIHCATNLDLKEIISDKIDMSVLAHEYIHFLQDVSTTFGLFNLCNLYNRVRYAARVIYESTESEILLPIKVDEDTLRSAIYAYNVVNPVNQDHSHSDLSKFNLILAEEKSESICGLTLRKYALKDLSKGFRYQIGARDILESMAYIIERNLYGDLNPASMLPYKTAEVLVMSIFPQIIEKKRLISVICELSLMSSHPAEMFIMTLRHLKQEHFIPSHDSEIIEFILNEVQFKSSNGVTTTTFRESIEYATSLAHEYIYEFLKAHQFLNLWRWSQKVLNRAYIERTTDPIFITRLLMTSNGRLNLFAMMKSRIGIPVIINGVNELFTFEQDDFSDQLLLFPAIEQVVGQLFYKDQEKCDLLPVCEKILCSRLDSFITSSECHSSPWRKVVDYSLCPFATIWRSWGFGLKEYRK